MAQFNLDNGLSSPAEIGRVTQLPEPVSRGKSVGPRLVGGTSFGGKSALDAAQVQILAQACLEGPEAARQVVFGWQRKGHSLEEIYLLGITPCARLVGEWWLSDKLDFVMCNIVFVHLQKLLHDFSAEFLLEAPEARNGWSLLLLTEPGAHHSMGLFMLSEFFKRAGWMVTLGVPQDEADFKRLFQSDWFDAVGISVSTDRHLLTLATVLPPLKAASDNLNLHMFVGGPMASREPARFKSMGAEVVSGDPPETVARITQGMSLGVSKT